jgi:hypothetical protein
VHGSIELPDAHLSIREDSAHIQVPTQRFNTLGERTHADVRAMFNLRNLALIHPQDLPKLKLRQCLRFAESIEGHRGQAVQKSTLDLLLPLRRHRIQSALQITGGG